MGQRTSQLWDRIFQMRGTTRQYQFDVAGTVYGPESEVSHSYSNGLYEEFGIGNAISAKLTLSLYAESIPRAAVIKRYIRLRNEDADLTSEWIPKGVFYTNRRTEDDGLWTVDAFDAMRKAERLWVPGEELAFPLPVTEAAEEFARLMGVELDPRTKLNPAYVIPEYPYDQDYTIRDMLRFLAAAHGGNWTVTDEGRLLLVPLLSAPPDAGLLVTEHGRPITLGGVGLVVDWGEVRQAEAAAGCFQRYYAGLDLTGLRKNSVQRPVSRVTLTGAPGGDLSAGDDSGLELTAECPFATAEMVNAVLGGVRGGKYEMYSADDVNVDPAMELGDGVSMGSVYSVIARVDDDGCGWPGLSQPGKTELEDEFPYASGEKRKRKVLENKVEDLETKVEDLETKVEDLQEIIDNFEGGGLNGVLSFNERTGHVLPQEEDYKEFIDEAIQKAIYESWGAAY